MRRQLQRMGKCQERPASLAAQFLAVGAIAAAHQRRAPHFPRGCALTAVRQTQRVPQFMTHAAHEDAVVAPHADEPVLPVRQPLRLLPQQIRIQERRVHLPRRAAPAVPARIIRTVMTHRPLVRVPVGQIAEDHHRLAVGIHARFLQHAHTIAPDFLPVRTIGFAAFRRLQSPLRHRQPQQAVRIHLQPDAPLAESPRRHLPRVEGLNVPHHPSESLAIGRLRLAVRRRPVDHAHHAPARHRILLLPSLQHPPRPIDFHRRRLP